MLPDQVADRLQDGTAVMDLSGFDCDDIAGLGLDSADAAARALRARDPDVSAVQARYAPCLAFETDCADAHASMRVGAPDFVLIDVWAPGQYRQGHVTHALNLPRGEMTARRTAEWPTGTLFVVYCAGPHCNGADRAAVHLAGLSVPVKVMTDGITGWVDEGYAMQSA